MTISVPAITDLLNTESVELAAALTATLANGEGLRVLFIKGPAAVAAEVRPPRTSADIDVLVHPEDSDRLLTILLSRGWAVRPFADGMGIPQHSHTLYHPEWPSDIDVHFRFPGLDAEPAEAFAALAKNHAHHSFAGVEADVPNHTGMALIQITHALRNLHLNGSQSSTAHSDYEFLLNRTDSLRWEDLLVAMSGTKSLAAMKPFLLKAYPAQCQSVDFPMPSLDWQARTTTHFAGTHRIVQLLQAPWKDKPRIVYRSVFPTRENLAAANLELLNADRATLAIHRRERIIRFLTQPFHEVLADR